MGCRCCITVGVGMFLLSLFIMDSCVCCAVMSGGVFLEVLSICVFRCFSVFQHNL